MTNPASLNDLEARWRPFSQQEAENALVFMDDAWRMLRRRYSTLEADTFTDQDLNDEAARVVATAVLRVMKNPDGKRKESIDDYSWERDQAVSAGLLFFTEAELTALYPDAPRGAFSINVLPSGYPDSRFTS